MKKRSKGLSQLGEEKKKGGPQYNSNGGNTYTCQKGLFEGKEHWGIQYSFGFCLLGLASLKVDLYPSVAEFE